MAAVNCLLAIAPCILRRKSSHGKGQAQQECTRIGPQLEASNQSRVAQSCDCKPYTETRMRPLVYLPNDVSTGARIGGAAPDELLSQFRDEYTQYFGTFPLLGGDSTEFTIFHRIDPFEDAPVRDAIANNNQILTPPELLWCVVHNVSHRGTTIRNAFEARGMIVGDETDDLLSNEDANDPQLEPYAESKLGGACYVERYQIREAVQELERSGFQQLLQIGMDGPDLIEGFPWDPGYLNVWALNPTDPTSYRFCIQQ